jgi:hypothetical protein
MLAAPCSIQGDIMDNFLDFLNSADAAELTKLSGIDTAMAERIIEARPFESDEDLQRVSGLGEKSIEKLKAAFEKLDQIIIVGNQTPARIQDKNTNATITIKTEAPQEKEAPKEKHGFWYYVKRFFQGLFILLLVVIIVGGFGYGLSIGIPYFVDNIIRPIENNTGQISKIATQQASDLLLMEEDITTLQAQIDSLQTQNDNNINALDTQSEHLSAMATMQMDLNNHVATLEVGLGDQLDEQEAALMSDIEYNLKTSQAIQLLSRANLYLAQSNYGMARQDLSTAFSLLDAYINEAPADKQDFLKMVIDRIEMAIFNLPSYPVVAANDVQIAWQYLVDDNDPAAPVNIPLYTNSATPTPFDLPASTPTYYAIPEGTYTPYPPITATVTPTDE